MNEATRILEGAESYLSDRTMADWAREDWAETPLPINIWQRYGDRYFSANGPVAITEFDSLLEQQLSDLEEGRHFTWKEAARILQQELRDMILTRNIVGWSAINAQIKRAKLERDERDEEEIQRIRKTYYDQPSDKEKIAEQNEIIKNHAAQIEALQNDYQALQNDYQALRIKNQKLNIEYQALQQDNQTLYQESLPVPETKNPVKIETYAEIVAANPNVLSQRLQSIIDNESYFDDFDYYEM